MAKNEVSLKSRFGEELLGYAWTIDKPKQNVVIVTGMEEYAGRYEELALFLNKNGFNVYCIDQYGQGLNAPNESEQGVVPNSFFSKSVKNIDDIVTKLRSSLVPTTIFGHSMGSFMVQDYIQRFTDHINKVIICGSNGPNAKLSYSFGKFVASILKIGKNRDKKSTIMNSIVFGMYKKAIPNAKSEFDWLSTNEENVQKYIADPQCGYMSTNGFYYEFMKGCARLYKKKFLKKIRKDMHILIISGSDDPVGAKGKGPAKLGELYQKLGLEDVEVKIYEGLRHEIHNETGKEQVWQDIVNFLNEKCEPAEMLVK